MEIKGIGSKDGKDYVEVIDEEGKATVYVGDSLDDTNTVDDHFQKIIDGGVVASEDDLDSFAQ